MCPSSETSLAWPWCSRAELVPRSPDKCGPQVQRRALRCAESAPSFQSPRAAPAVPACPAAIQDLPLLYRHSALPGAAFLFVLRVRILHASTGEGRRFIHPQMTTHLATAVASLQALHPQRGGDTRAKLTAVQKGSPPKHDIHSTKPHAEGLAQTLPCTLRTRNLSWT